MRLREAWARSRRRLERAAIPDAGIEAQVLGRSALRLDRTAFYASLEETLSDDDSAAIERAVDRRIEGEPLAYITGRREFYGFEFVVTADVLVPRQETELLVEAVLDYVRRNGRDERPITIGDIGTGSGAIAVALGRHVEAAKVYATDSSPSALRVAEVNARRHGLAERVHVREGDLFGALDGPVDVVVSNPPYLSEAEMSELPPDVRREPRNALSGGADGMDVLRRLMEGASGYVNPGGLLAFEIDPRRLGAVEGLAARLFAGAEVNVVRDYADLDRMVTVEFAG